MLNDGEALFLVQGTLSQVQHAHTVVNLLAKFEKHSQTKNLACSVHLSNSACPLAFQADTI
jgi:hypothetical protein